MTFLVDLVGQVSVFFLVLDIRSSLQNIYRLAARRPENSPPDCFLNGLSNPTVK